MNELRSDRVESPLGALEVVVHGDRLCALDFADRESLVEGRLRRRFGDVRVRAERDPAGFATRVRAYLEGELDALEEIPVETGGTRFQRAVWRALRRVPCGATRSYGEIAREIGAPRAVRAVGSASGRNPVALVVPCHRIVAADGGLGGYAGGRDRKRWLLDHERAPVPPASRAGAAQSSSSRTL